MTVKDTNDPEISFDPSASSRPTAPPADDLPAASATAIPVVSATAVPDSTSGTQSSLLPDGSNIERTANADGSLSVKVTKTTTQSDGSRSIRIEEYEIPANMARTVVQSMDMTGEAPTSLYLTRIEDHRLPPGSQNDGVGTGGTVQTGGTAYPTAGASSGGSAAGGAAITTAPVMTGDNEQRQILLRWCAVVGVSMVVGLVMAGVLNSRHSSSISWDDDNWSNPTYPTVNDDYYFSRPSPQNQPIWSPSFPSYTLPPEIFKPLPPTKSPSPSTSPYPSWDYESFKFTLSPALYNMFPPAAQRNDVDTSENGSQNRLGQGNAEKKKKIEVIPAIISPTFMRDPTNAPTHAPSKVDNRKGMQQDAKTEEDISIARRW